MNPRWTGNGRRFETGGGVNGWIDRMSNHLFHSVDTEASRLLRSEVISPHRPGASLASSQALRTSLVTHCGLALGSNP